MIFNTFPHLILILKKKGKVRISTMQIEKIKKKHVDQKMPIQTIMRQLNRRKLLAYYYNTQSLQIYLYPNLNCKMRCSSFHTIIMLLSST